MNNSSQEKKPDIIVWDNIRGYYAKGLTYGTNLSAPSIKMEDVKGWRNSGAISVNHHFKSKFEELKLALENLFEEFNWNELIYNHVEYDFTPIIGQVYYLYKKKDESLFLSLIEPTTWDRIYIGSFKLESSNKWVKI